MNIEQLAKEMNVTVNDVMNLAQSMMRNPCKHDWVMDVLRCVYEMRKVKYENN